MAGIRLFSKKRHARVVMYSTRYCGYCTRARRLLEQKGISYEEIMIDNNRELWQEMEARSKSRSVPQIFIGDVHVGGCTDLYALEAEGRLDELLFISED